MLLARYARKNLGRQRGRSLLTAVAVVLAVALIIVGTTLIDGITEHVMEEFARQTGHVRVRHPEYDRLSRFEPLDYTVGDVAARIGRFEALPEVAVVLPRLRFPVMLQYTDTSTIVPEGAGVQEEELSDEQIFGRKVLELASSVGVDAPREPSRTRLDATLVRGRWLGAAPDEIVLGSELAARLGVDVGKDLEIVSFRGGLRDASARVVGVFDSGNRLMNRASYVPIALAQRLLELPDQATELLVFGEALATSPRVVSALEVSGVAQGLSLVEWRDVGFMRTASRIFDVIFGVLLVAILLVAAAGLLNTLLMSVLERRREIGVLLALGLSRRRVVVAIVMEALILSVLGAAVGVALGVLASLYLVEHGIVLGHGAAANLPVAIGDVMHGRLTWLGVARAAALGLVTAFLGALWPAWKASAMSPVEAMKRR